MERNSEARKPDRLSFIQKKDTPWRVSRKARTEESGIRLRGLQDKDREQIQEVLEDLRFFTPEEIEVAISLVDEVLHGSSAYRFVVAAEENDKVVGYICYGQTPMAVGTWDIYWIAVSKTFQRKRIGSLLLREAEKDISTEGGRLILIETSTKPSYRSTRRFYNRMGYRVSAMIAKFYSEEDDKLIFCKYLAS